MRSLTVLLTFCMTSFIGIECLPRWSWGKLADVDQQDPPNTLLVECSEGKCVLQQNCPDGYKAPEATGTCSNRTGGPWICCDVFEMENKYSILTPTSNPETNTKFTISDIEIITNDSNEHDVNYSVSILKENSNSLRNIEHGTGKDPSLPVYYTSLSRIPIELESSTVKYPPSLFDSRSQTRNYNEVKNGNVKDPTSSVDYKSSSRKSDEIKNSTVKYLSSPVDYRYHSTMEDSSSPVNYRSHSRNPNEVEKSTIGDTSSQVDYTFYSRNPNGVEKGTMEGSSSPVEYRFHSRSPNEEEISRTKDPSTPVDSTSHSNSHNELEFHISKSGHSNTENGNKPLSESLRNLGESGISDTENMNKPILNLFHESSVSLRNHGESKNSETENVNKPRLSSFQDSSRSVSLRTHGESSSSDNGNEDKTSLNLFYGRPSYWESGNSGVSNKNHDSSAVNKWGRSWVNKRIDVDEPDQEYNPNHPKPGNDYLPSYSRPKPQRVPETDSRTTRQPFRKPTRDSWETGYNRPTSRRTESKTTKSHHQSTRKTNSWDHEYDSDFRKKTTQFPNVATTSSWKDSAANDWYNGYGPNSGKASTTIVRHGAPGNKPTRSWNEEDSSRKSTRKTWSHESFPTPKSTRTTGYVRDVSKATSTKTSRPMQKSTTPSIRRTSYNEDKTMRSTIPTRQGGIGSTKRSWTDQNRGNSVSPRYKSTTKTTEVPINRRSSTRKPMLTTPLPDINNQLCGIRVTSSDSNSRGRRGVDDPDSIVFDLDSRSRSSYQRVVGGKEAEPFSWPWVAAIYKVNPSGGNRFLSAGSLINENYVLTAAHIFTPDDLGSSSYIVMLGTHTAKSAMAQFAVTSILRHPDYQQRLYYHDIALLRLERPVVFNDYMVPVCLPSPSKPLLSDKQLVGKKVTVMGWGDESYGGVTSRVLREATFPIVSRQSCNASYVQVASNRFPKGITSNLLCAGAPGGGKDACQGDSGGPLTTFSNGIHTQVGIVSFGYKCGDKDYPGVYTKVAPYLGWIAENARCEGHPNVYYSGRGYFD